MKAYTAERLTKVCPEKSWTKHGANKLLKKLQDIGTVDRRPVSGRPRSEKKIAVAFVCLIFQNIPLTHKYTQYTQVHECNLLALSSYLLNKLIF